MPYTWNPVAKAQVADDAAINALGAAVSGHDAVLARMGCTLRRVAPQTLPDAAFTALVLDTEDADTNALYPGSGDTITIPAGGVGIWAVYFSIITAASPTGLAMVSLEIGGISPRFPFGDNVCGGGMTMPLNPGNTIRVIPDMDTAAGTTMSGIVYAYRVAA